MHSLNQQQQIEIGLYALLGAIAGIVLGFAMARSHYSFVSWLTDTDHSLGWLWAVMGAIAGAAIYYLRIARR